MTKGWHLETWTEERLNTDDSKYHLQYNVFLFENKRPTHRLSRLSGFAWKSNFTRQTLHEETKGICELSSCDIRIIRKDECVMISMSCHLQEVQCVLGFLLGQVDPEDPAKWTITTVRTIKRMLITWSAFHDYTQIMWVFDNMYICRYNW